MPVKVVFVCLGNICRSPMAEGVFRDMVRKAGLEGEIEVDSAGTSAWHIGEYPHPGTDAVLHQHGIRNNHKARQLGRDDLHDADYLIAMDRENLDGIRRLGPSDGEVALLLDYAPGVEETEVPDPYYGGGFDTVYELVEAGSRALLAHIRQREGL